MAITREAPGGAPTARGRSGGNHGRTSRMRPVIATAAFLAAAGSGAWVFGETTREVAEDIVGTAKDAVITMVDENEFWLGTFLAASGTFGFTANNLRIPKKKTYNLNRFAINAVAAPVAVLGGSLVVHETLFRDYPEANEVTVPSGPITNDPNSSAGGSTGAIAETTTAPATTAASATGEAHCGLVTDFTNWKTSAETQSDVHELQQWLADSGYYERAGKVPKVDNIPGGDTNAAVDIVQQDMGMTDWQQQPWNEATCEGTPFWVEAA